MIRNAEVFEGTERYELVTLLGSGGMGTVFEVVDNDTSKHVALKVMTGGTPTDLLRFKREFRLAAELHHPGLVRLFDLHVEGGRWFFTMELVRGKPLLEALRVWHDDVASLETTKAFLPDSAETPRAGPLLNKQEERKARAQTRRYVACEPDRIREITLELLDALEFLHRRGILHRDLKPHNILIDAEGTARVLDFGLASRMDGSAYVSRDGGVLGTVAYMSPEQCRGEPATEASDLYALGSTLYHALAAEPPFSGTAAEVIAERLTGDAPRIRDVVRGVPADLGDLCDRLIAVDPADRPTIEECRRLLGSAKSFESWSSGSIFAESRGGSCTTNKHMREHASTVARPTSPRVVRGIAPCGS